MGLGDAVHALVFENEMFPRINTFFTDTAFEKQLTVHKP